MSEQRKPRGDAVLKTLPIKRQEEIVEHALGHTLAETVAWLKADGLKTSSAALSQWLSWYQLRQRLQRNQSVVETLMETLRHTDPHLKPEELFAVGQSLFATLAIESQDPKVWIGTQRLALQQQQVFLDARRVELLERRAQQAEQAETVAKSDLTPEAKQARMREIFGLK